MSCGCRLMRYSKSSGLSPRACDALVATTRAAMPLIDKMAFCPLVVTFQRSKPSTIVVSGMQTAACSGVSPDSVAVLVFGNAVSNSETTGRNCTRNAL